MKLYEKILKHPSLIVLQTAAVGAAQRIVEKAAGKASTRLGLGWETGARMGSRFLSRDMEAWEAQIDNFSPANVAEACTILLRQSLVSFFDLEAGECYAIETLSMRWLAGSGSADAGFASKKRSGVIKFAWEIGEREEFRRRALERPFEALGQGARQELNLIGIDSEGLAVVEIELMVWARVRAQISEGGHA